MSVESQNQATPGGNVREISPMIGDHLLKQLLAALGDTGTEEEKRARKAHIVETIKSMQPRDKIEEMLAAQIIMTHETSMECMKRANAGGIDELTRQSELRMAAKYSKLLTEQLAGLYTYRHKELVLDIGKIEKKVKESESFWPL